MSNDVVARYTLNFKDMASKGMLKVSTNAKKMQNGLKGVSSGIATVSKGLGVAGVALGVAMGAAVNQNLEMVKDLKVFAQVANTTTQDFQKMAAGATAYGIESDKLADILKDVNDRVGDFNATGGGPMKDFFENVAPKVGITAEMFKDLSGKDALQLYYDGLEKANLSQADMTFYMEAMASDTTNLIPLLKNGGVELDKFGKIAQESGAIMSEFDIKNAEKLNADLKVMGLQWQGFKTSVVRAVMPMLQAFSDFYKANSALISTNLATFFDNLSTAASNVDVEAVANGFVEFGGAIVSIASTISTLVDFLGGAGNAIKIFVGVLAVGQIAGFIAAVGSAISFITPIVSFLITAVTSLSGVFSALSGVAAFVGTVIAGISAPVVLAIGAIIAIGVLLYKNWDTVKTVAIATWNGIVSIVATAFELIGAIFTGDLATIKAIALSALNGIKQIFSIQFAAIKFVVTTVISAIKLVFSTSFNAIKNIVSSAIARVKARFSAGLSAMKSVVTGKIQGIISAFLGLKAKLIVIGGQAVQGLINGIRNKIKGAIAVARNLASSVSSTVKNFFSIRSPSRLFTEFGGHLSTGLAIGIADKTKLAVNATKLMAKQVSDVDFTAPSNNGFDIGGEVKKTAEIRRNVQNTYDVRVHIDGKVDGAKVQANVTHDSQNNGQGGNMPFSLA